MAHAKSGIRKLGHDLLVSGDSTDSSGTRGCPVIARGTRVASYATRSTAMLVAGEYKYTVHVTRTRILWSMLHTVLGVRMHTVSAYTVTLPYNSSTLLVKDALYVTKL